MFSSTLIRSRCAIPFLYLNPATPGRPDRTPVALPEPRRPQVTFCVKGVITPPCGTPCFPDAFSNMFRSHKTASSDTYSFALSLASVVPRSLSDRPPHGGRQRRHRG